MEQAHGVAGRRAAELHPDPDDRYQPGSLCRHHAVLAPHHSGQAHPGGFVQPDAGRHHAAAAADCLHLRDRHRLRAGVPAGHSCAARSWVAALQRRHAAAHGHHRHDRRRRRQHHRRVRPVGGDRRRAKPLAAGHAGGMEHRRDVLHLRDLHVVSSHRSFHGALMDFLFSYIVLAEIYVLLGLSTNLLVGIVGIFSVSQAAVFGVGAYLVAHFTMATDPLSFIPSMVIAAVCCVALNILVTLPSLRVSGDYFVVTSFGIQLLATAVFTNWTAGTGGANGLPGIPPPDLFGKALESSSSMVMLCAGGMVLGCLIFWLVMR